MLSNIKSKIKDIETKSKPPPPPPSKPKHLFQSRIPAPEVASSNAKPGKRGLGWPWDNPASHFPLYEAAITAKILTWIFNWELWRPEGTPRTVEWVPCVRTAAQAKDIIPFLSDISAGLNLPIKHFLGFNEPEIPDQANLSVDEAVWLWKESVLPAKRKFGFRLGSPGMSSDVSRSKPWLNDFFAKLDGGHGVNFLVVHWYGPHFADMKWFLEDMHATYGLPLWVNEFACSNMGAGEASAAEVEAFVNEAVLWLDTCEWVERYAYFGNAQGRDVGTWVGRESNFTELGEGLESTEGRRLSSIGRLYLQG